MTILYIIGLPINRTFSTELEHKQWDKFWNTFKLKRVVPTVLFITSSLLILLPNQNTLISMYVTSKITPALIKSSLKTGISIKENIKNDIIEIIKETSTENDTKELIKKIIKDELKK